PACSHCSSLPLHAALPISTADFFIVVGDLVSMDGKPDGDPGYAVFGRVVQGMDVVRAMLELPRSADARNPVMKGQMLAEPVKVRSEEHTSELQSRENLVCR